MPPPPPGTPKSVRKGDIAALALVVLGIAGLVTHLTRETSGETAPAAPAGAARGEYMPTLPPRFTRARTHTEEDPARDMRRLLRDFIIPFPGVKNLPASDALAVLRHHWESLPHAGDVTPPPPFSDRLPPDYARFPVSVSLEIPGVSLLTNLRLLAAQAGLKLTLTDSGAALLPEENAEHRSPSRGEWPLTQATLSTYSSAASRLRSRHDPEQYGPVLTHSWILSPVFSTRQLAAPVPEVDIAPEVIEFDDFVNHGIALTPEIEGRVTWEPLVEDWRGSFTRDAVSDLDSLFADMAIPALPARNSPLDESVPDIDSPDPAARPEDTEESLPAMPADSPEDSIPSGWAWSRGDGMLSAAGDARVTRVAAEVATAIREASELGVRIEIVAVEWAANGASPPRPPDQLTYTTNPPSTRVGSGLVRCGAYDAVTFPAPPSRAYDLAVPLTDRLTLEIDASGSCFQLNSGVSLGDRPSYAPGLPAMGGAHGNMAHKFNPVMVSPGVWTRLDIPTGGIHFGGDPGGSSRPSLRQGLFLRVSRAVVSQE